MLMTLVCFLLWLQQQIIEDEKKYLTSIMNSKQVNPHEDVGLEPGLEDIKCTTNEGIQ